MTSPTNDFYNSMHCYLISIDKSKARIHNILRALKYPSRFNAPIIALDKLMVYIDNWNKDWNKDKALRTAAVRKKAALMKYKAKRLAQ